MCIFDVLLKIFITFMCENVKLTVQQNRVQILM